MPLGIVCVEGAQCMAPSGFLGLRLVRLRLSMIGLCGLSWLVT